MEPICLICCNKFKRTDNLNCLSSKSSILQRFLTVLERHFGRKIRTGDYLIPVFDHGNPSAEGLELQICPECSRILESACTFFHEMKRLELQLFWKMRLVKQRMKLGGKVTSRVTALKEMCASLQQEDNEPDAFQCITEFRQELIRKCCTQAFLPKVALTQIDQCVRHGESSTLSEDSSRTIQQGVSLIRSISLTEDSGTISDPDNTNHPRKTSNSSGVTLEDNCNQEEYPPAPDSNSDENVVPMECDVSHGVEPDVVEIPDEAGVNHNEGGENERDVQELRLKILNTTSMRGTPSNQPDDSQDDVTFLEEIRPSWTLYRDEGNACSTSRTSQMTLQGSGKAQSENESEQLEAMNQTQVAYREGDGFEVNMNFNEGRDKNGAPNSFAENQAGYTSLQDQKPLVGAEDGTNCGMEKLPQKLRDNFPPEWLNLKILNDEGAPTIQDFLSKPIEEVFRFKCEITTCCERFATPAELQKHSKLHGAQCMFCKKEFYALSLACHEAQCQESKAAVQIQLGNPVIIDCKSCSRCPWQSSTSGNATSDYVAHHLKEHLQMEMPTKMSCPLCEETWCTIIEDYDWVTKQFFTHMQSHLEVSNMDTSPNLDIPGPELTSYKFQCEIDSCTLHFGNSKELENHRTHHGNFKCVHCPVVFNYAPHFALHEAEHRGRVAGAKGKIRIDCSRCHESFQKIAVEKNYITHFLDKHLSLPWATIICSICQKGSGRLDNENANKIKKKHFREYHDLHYHRKAASVFNCDECSAYFLSVSQLHNHQLEVHETKLPCETCGFQFTTRSSLLSHRKRRHKNSEAFSCIDEGCSERFDSEENMIKHASLHHKSTSNQASVIMGPDVSESVFTPTFGENLNSGTIGNNREGDPENILQVDPGVRFGTTFLVVMN